MGELIHIELRKMRTVRAPALLLAASALIIVAGVSGLVVSGADLRAPGTVSQALSHAGLVSLLTLILGIASVAGEHRNRTITDTYLSTPRRGRVIVAKLAAAIVAALAFALANVATALIATSLWWAAKGVPLSLSDPSAWRVLVGCAAWNVGFAVIGVGVGALVRNLTAAIAVALAWIALVEGIVGQLISGWARWLPFASGSALGRMAVPGSGAHPLSQLGAGLALAGYAAVFAVLAVSTTVRRDVT